jgi:two-component system, LytTR family, response regulator LytT
MQKILIDTIAVDDEPLALRLVCGYIEKTSFLNLKASFENPLTASDYLLKNKVDLIFLDIQMPDLIGTDFVRNLPYSTKIIFTTAFEKYALESYKLEAVDYLLKPFEYGEFLCAAKKAQRLLKLEADEKSAVETSDYFLFLKSEYKIRRINFEDILYIEGLKDYVKVYLRNDPKPVLSINSLKNLEEKLPASRFMRVHRSFIVNLAHIGTIERSRIVFGSVYIPVSEQYRENFQKFLDDYFL